jgi:molybdopterin synthase catalytic subunit
VIEISAQPLELAPLIAAVSDASCGAVVTFLGIVRATAEDGRAVDGLSYEAYRAMALPELTAIASEARAAFDGVRIAIVHRTGTLGVGEPSVAIAAAAPHRAPAFDACEYAIDELKKRVPIWKKERYVDGASAWRENGPERSR